MEMSHIIGIVVGIALWGLVAVLALTAAVRSKTMCREGLREGARDFVVLIPRVMIGVVGSGYIAARHAAGPDRALDRARFRLRRRCSSPRSAGAMTPGGAGRRLLDRRRGAQGRRRRAAGDRLYDRLGALRDPAAVQLGNSHDAAAGGVAAGGGLAAAAVPRRARPRCCSGNRDGTIRSNASPRWSRGMIAPRWRITSPGEAMRGRPAAALGPFAGEPRRDIAGVEAVARRRGVDRHDHLRHRDELRRCRRRRPARCWGRSSPRSRRCRRPAAARPSPPGSGSPHSTASSS